MDYKIIQQTENFVRALFAEKLSKDFLFHDLNHTLTVKDYTQLLGRKIQLKGTDLEVLAIAALLHDTGYTEVYQGHEAASKKIAETFLNKQEYPKEKLESVLKCIDATVWDAHPTNVLEAVIKDADLANVGSDDFFEKSNLLRKEWEILCKESYSDEDWMSNEIKFLKTHKYYTKVAQSHFGLSKKNNLRQLLKTTKKKKSKSKINSIADSRSAQMMFKTSLRNHIDLTNIADNKANIMLSINTLLITLSMPLFAGFYTENHFILIPFSILALTCTLTIIFATMATRPIKMLGSIKPEKIKEGKSNVFFFGNFFKMDTSQFHSAVNEVISDQELLEKTIVNDLYYLGKALGEKYAKLRICYMIFMVGITATVITFALSFLQSA